MDWQVAPLPGSNTNQRSPSINALLNKSGLISRDWEKR